MTSAATSPGGRSLRSLLGVLLLLCPRIVVGDGAAETWQMIGPQSATVFSGARDPSNPSLFMVGTHYGGIYRSFDGGQTWGHLQNELSSAAVFTMRADPTAPGTFYAGAFERGIYRTPDNGVTWVALNNGLTNRSVVGLSINPFNTQELLATTFGGVFRSDDAGATWNAPDPSGSEPAISVFFSKVTSGVCYLGRDQQSILRSSDSGATWAPWGQGLLANTTVLWIEADPDALDIIYIGTAFGIFRRREGDAAWTNLNFNLPPDAAVNHVSFHPDGRVFAATEVGVFTLEERTSTIWHNWSLTPARFVFVEPYGTTIHLAGTELSFQLTLTDGINFGDATAGIQNNFPDALASVVVGNTSYLFAGSDLGPSRTTGPQVAVAALWLPPVELKNELILELRPDPNNTNILFAGTERAGVWRTNDLGVTWNQKSDGITPNTVTSISQSPVGDHLMYAGTSTGLYISEDDGQSWRVGPQVAIPSFVAAAEADQAAPNVAYFGTNFGEIIVTVNGGQTFQSSFELPNEPVVRIASARFRNVFAVMKSGRVFSSSDQGNIWSPKDQEINHPGSDLDFSQPRPWIGYLSTLGGGVYRTGSEGTSWTQVNTGIDNPYLFSIAVDRLNESTVYAGSIGKIYKTTNEGASWTAMSNGLPVDGIVTDLVVNPTNSNLIHASVLKEGIYFSDDGGVTWAPRGTEAPFQDANTIPLATSFETPGRIFSGSRLEGLFKSDDSGLHWEESSNGITDLVRGIQVSHQDSNRVYAGTLNSGMFLSENGGEHWSHSGLLGRQIIHTAIDPFNGNHVYAATASGLAATFDGGATWQELGQRLALVFAIASDPADRDKLFLGGPGGGFFSSADGGKTSVKGGLGLPVTNMQSLCRTTGGILFAGMDIGGGVFRSDDDGQTWTKISSGQFSNERANEILFDDSTGELFVIGDKTGLFKTDAAGSNWSIIPAPGGDPILNPLAIFQIDPFNPDHFALARFNQSAGNMSLHFSPDRGANWTTVPGGVGLPTGSIWTVEFSPLTPGLLLAAHEDGIHRSTDGGLSWNQTFDLPSGVMYQLQFDPTNPMVVYGGSSEGGLYVSHDQGSTWTPAPVEPSDVQVSDFALGAKGTVHAATFTSGILSTSDAGATWSLGIDSDLAQFVANFVSVDPAYPRNVYVAASSQGVLKSEDGGYTWKRKNNGLGANLTALTVIVDPLDPDTLYLGTITDGVYVSEDAGESWTSLREGMFHELVIALTTDAADHRTVYAGVEGGGVYQIRRGAKTLDGTKDHDRDGILTLVEEYMGLNPLRPNPPGLYSGKMNTSAGRYELRWMESGQPTGITAVPEWSPNLQDWYASGDGPGGCGPLIVVFDLGVHPGGFRVKEAYMNAPGGKRFLRLNLNR